MGNKGRRTGRAGPAFLIPHSSFLIAGLCLAALPLLFLGLTARGFSDNEGMYAELGRGILRTGDWLTPHLNGAPYLNKPPLLAWLIALVLRVTGDSEWPRLISGLATLGTMLLLFDLGRRLWPQPAGAGGWTAAVFLSSALTAVEARILRPDALLMFLITLIFWGVVRLDTGREGSDRLGVAAIWGGAGLALMTKGLLGWLLPALALFPALCLGKAVASGQCSVDRAGPAFTDHRPLTTGHCLMRRYFPFGGLLLGAAIVLPWHIAVGWVNRGFWWDYIVNQHLLYFFDHKFPRDSVSQPLWFAWAAFAGRLAPWVLLLPAAVLRQLRQARTAPTVTAWLPLTWLGTILLFFSISKGRLEHYFLPAIPAAALLIGRLCAEWAEASSRSPEAEEDSAAGDRTPQPSLVLAGVHPGDGGLSQPALERPAFRLPSPSLLAPLSPGVQRLRVLPFLLVTVIAAVGLAVAPGLLRSSGVMSSAPGLLPAARGAFGVVVIGGLLATFLALSRRVSPALGVLVATFLLFQLFACRGLNAVDRLVSARQLVREIDPALLAHSAVAYEAGDEYQLCGALNFYLRRRLLILEPPGFIPPTYLEGYTDRLFVHRDSFWREWRQGRQRFLLFTDPTQPLDRPLDALQPCTLLGHSGDHLLLTNLPVRR